MSLGRNPFKVGDISTGGVVNATKLLAVLNEIANSNLDFQATLKPVGESGYLIRGETPTNNTDNGIAVISPEVLSKGRP